MKPAHKYFSTLYWSVQKCSSRYIKFIRRRWAAHTRTHDIGAEQNCSFFMHKHRKTSGKSKGWVSRHIAGSVLSSLVFSSRNRWINLVLNLIARNWSQHRPSTPKSLYNPLQKCYIMKSVPWTGSAEQNLWEEALIQQRVSVERDLFLCPSKFPLFTRTNQC